MQDKWREFTPLPIVLQLQEISEVKMMHDVSEGGLIGSLLELDEVLKMKIQLDSSKLIISEDWEIIDDVILRAPSYGVLIVVIEPQGKEKIMRKCDEVGLPCIFLDPLVEGTGLYIDGNHVEEQVRINLDKIYGTFPPEKSENE
jgi:selenophosphate synthetase-related protein